MIVQEINGDMVRTYSDAGFYIHGGFPEGDYEEAYDPVSMGRVYIETNIPIPSPEDDPTEEDYANAGRILMGVEE